MRLRLMSLCAALYVGAVSGQTPDQDAANAMQRGSQEVIRTRETTADKFETSHLILYIDMGLLDSDAEQEFAGKLERLFVATAEYLQRRFDGTRNGVPKPTYYLTDRAGISHAGSAEVFLFAQRVIPQPGIAIHETTHLLLTTDPSAPRNRDDLPPEEDRAWTAITGVWLDEGFATYVAAELARRLGMSPGMIFLKGDNSTVDSEARDWIKDPRARTVVSFVASRGAPESILADRDNVAAPFYVLSQSFVKYLVAHVGLRAVVQLNEEHANGRATIEDDVKRITGTDLATWRQGWLRDVNLEETR